MGQPMESLGVDYFTKLFWKMSNITVSHISAAPNTKLNSKWGFTDTKLCRKCEF